MVVLFYHSGVIKKLMLERKDSETKKSKLFMNQSISTDDFESSYKVNIVPFFHAIVITTYTN